MNLSPLKVRALKANLNYVRTNPNGRGQDGLVWHICKHRVLYADTDCSRTVYHSNYLHYFELGRTSLMRRHCATNSAGIPVAVDEKTVKLWQNFPK